MTVTDRSLQSLSGDAWNSIGVRVCVYVVAHTSSLSVGKGEQADFEETVVFLTFFGRLARQENLEKKAGRYQYCSTNT